MNSMPATLPIRHIAPRSVGWSITLSVLLILLGIAALVMPLLAGLAAEVWASWLFVLGGIMHLILAFHVRGAGAHVWEALIGILYLLIGGFLFFHPLAGLVSLTMALGIYLILKAVFEIVAGILLRPVAGGVWLLVDAGISVVLAVIIWTQLPFSAAWVLGTIVGISILVSGLSRLALALAARRTHAAFA